MTLLPNWKVKSPVTNLAEQKMAQPCKGHSLERMLMKWVASMSTKKEVSVEHFLQETGINKSFHIATYPRAVVGIFLFKTETRAVVFFVGFNFFVPANTRSTRALARHNSGIRRSHLLPRCSRCACVGGCNRMHRVDLPVPKCLFYLTT